VPVVSKIDFNGIAEKKNSESGSKPTNLFLFDNNQNKEESKVSEETKPTETKPATEENKPELVIKPVEIKRKVLESPKIAPKSETPVEAKKSEEPKKEEPKRDYEDKLASKLLDSYKTSKPVINSDNPFLMTKSQSDQTTDSTITNKTSSCSAGVFQNFLQNKNTSDQKAGSATRPAMFKSNVSVFGAPLAETKDPSGSN
jgi:hypothetical protein